MAAASPCGIRPSCGHSLGEVLSPAQSLATSSVATVSLAGVSSNALSCREPHGLGSSTPKLQPNQRGRNLHGAMQRRDWMREPDSGTLTLHRHRDCLRTSYSLSGFKVAASLSNPRPSRLSTPFPATWQSLFPPLPRHGHGYSPSTHQVTSSAGRTTVAAPPVLSAHNPKDMYADLARYGIMDEFDMAPLPYYAASSTLAPPAQAPPPPGSPASLPKAPPGRPRRGTVDIDVVPTDSAGSISREAGVGQEEALTRGSAHWRVNEAEDGAVFKGGHGPEEAGPGTWCVYLLLAADKRKTYVGVTNDVERRLKQHNGEIVGGAKTTKAGRPWALICSVSGFQTRSEAFQFEWRWKNPRAVKGDGSFDRNSMAPAAQILRESEAAAATGGLPVVPQVVERRRAALEEALRTFPKWRYLQVIWTKSLKR